MEPIVCPAILASSADEYRKQIEQTVHAPVRLHIDLTDGTLTPGSTIRPDEVWWPGGMRADMHVMYKRPFEHAELLMDLGPQLIIVHAEAEGEFAKFAKRAHRRGVEVGVALQAQTPVSVILPALELIDHVLIFSGSLGEFGGHADLTLLDKVKALHSKKPSLEIGWDGGVNTDNISQIAAAGVTVLNSGGFIQKSDDPVRAFHQLSEAIAGRSKS